MVHVICFVEWAHEAYIAVRANNNHGSPALDAEGRVGFASVQFQQVDIIDENSEAYVLDIDHHSNGKHTWTNVI